MSDRWLEERLDGAPETLRERVLAAAGGEDAPAGTLTRAAEELLALAKEGPPTRETAMTLLAADALITLAQERALELK